MKLNTLAVPKPTGKDSRLSAVQQLFLWLNTGCNARCVTCEIWKDRSGRRLTADEVRRWAPDWKRFGVRGATLCGEATLHPEIWEICRLLRQEDIEIYLLSNGILLQRHAERVAEYCSSLTVSLDGPERIHNQVRGISTAFEKLARGVDAVKQRAPEMTIFGRCAVHRLNYTYLCETVDTARQLGLSSISFFGVDISSDAFGRPPISEDGGTSIGEWTSLRLEPDDLPRLEQELQRLEGTHCQSFQSKYIVEKYIVESEDLLHSALLGYFQSFHGLGTYGPRTRRCNLPWKTAVLEPDGAVRPCFFLPAYGNLRPDGDIESLINSPRALEYRANLDTSSHSLCKVCVCPKHIPDHQGRQGFTHA